MFDVSERNQSSVDSSMHHESLVPAHHQHVLVPFVCFRLADLSVFTNSRLAVAAQNTVILLHAHLEFLSPGPFFTSNLFPIINQNRSDVRLDLTCQ